MQNAIFTRCITYAWCGINNVIAMYSLKSYVAADCETKNKKPFKMWLTIFRVAPTLTPSVSTLFLKLFSSFHFGCNFNKINENLRIRINKKNGLASDRTNHHHDYYNLNGNREGVKWNLQVAYIGKVKNILNSHTSTRLKITLLAWEPKNPWSIWKWKYYLADINL